MAPPLFENTAGPVEFETSKLLKVGAK